MADKFAAIAHLFSCPDDDSPLSHSPGELRCARCGRRFPIYAEDIAEILPKRPCDLPSAVNTGYRGAYVQAAAQPFREDDSALAWGAEETVTKSWARRRRRQVEVARPMVTEKTSLERSILCDVAAGAGYYTLGYAHSFRLVLHCDLSVENLNYARRKAHALHIDNIIFVRADYFSLPFRGTMDRVICFDTLIRGEEHEKPLLQNIAASLLPSGLAVVDFHNWWHNPLRRLGLLPGNFGENRSYSRSQAEQVLRNAGIEDFNYRPYVQEVDPGSAGATILSSLLPATRLIYRFAPSPERQASCLASRTARAAR